MIYLVCVQDKKKHIAHVDCESDLQTVFWKSVINLTSHKTVLYSLEAFNLFSQPLPNRVNIVFFKSRKQKISRIPNALFTNNLREIINNFKNSDDDVYILGTTREMIEFFAKHADFLIIYETDDLGYTKQNLCDSINFADFDFLNKRSFNNLSVEYFVKTPINYLGY